MIDLIKKIIQTVTSKKDKIIDVKKSTKIDSNSIIGKYTYIGERCTITRAIIGRYCSIGNNVSIGPGEHDVDLVSTSSYLYCGGVWYDKLTEKPVVIGNDVWIGTDSIVRRGVTVGDGAVIGANTFVNKDVPPFAIVAGNPAKIIKYRFSQKKIEYIIQSKWWLLDLELARIAVRKLETIE